MSEGGERDRIVEFVDAVLELEDVGASPVASSAVKQLAAYFAVAAIARASGRVYVDRRDRRRELVAGCFVGPSGCRADLVGTDAGMLAVHLALADVDRSSENGRA